MNKVDSSHFRSLCAAICTFMLSIFFGNCSSSIQQPSGPGGQYSQAKAYFEKGDLEKAIERTESLARGSPPNDYTDRARVLRAVIFSGQMKGYMALFETYSKGLDKTKDSLAKTAFGAERRDNLQHGTQSALYLAQVAHLLTGGGAVPKDLTLDAPYPTSEGPVVVTQLNRVASGGMIGSDEVAAAARDAQRKSMDDVLADALGGDRAQARNTLKAGPAKLDSYKFSLFLARQLLDAAGIFDRKHSHDPEKYRLLYGGADEAAKAALAALKERPDKEKMQEVKRIQDEIKAGMKNI